jgi:uncharacterized membrane protein YhaH (DUF805 family)
MSEVSRSESSRSETWIVQNLRWIIVIAFATCILFVAGLGFVYKMTEFSNTIVRDDVAGFGATAIAVYLTGAIPLVMLTIWAVVTGRFRDIERPKYRVLELNDEIEAEAARRSTHV